MTTVDDGTGYAIEFGTYEDARALIGTRTEPREGEAHVNWGMIKHFCALVEDGNASYWDLEFAEREWGGIVSPPGMLMTWVMPIEWKPGAPKPVPLLTGRVPLPGDTIINVSNDTELLRPVLVGDRLSVTEELAEVSDEKTTRLGTGHFVTTVTTYRRQDGEVVGIMTNVLFRFTAAEAPA